MVFFILKNSKSIYVEIYIADWFKMGDGVLWELVGFLYGKIRNCMLNLIYINSSSRNIILDREGDCKRKKQQPQYIILYVNVGRRFH